MSNPDANSLTQLLPTTGLVVGQVDISEEAFANLSGPTSNARDDVSMVKNGTGDVTVTVKNFKGTQGAVFAFGTAIAAASAATIVQHAAHSYSGDDLSVQFLTEDDADGATDVDFDFQIWVA